VPTPIDQPLMVALSALALRAVQGLLPLAGAGLAVREKADRSPVTAADAASEAILLEGLARLLPGVPVVSEERADEAGAPRGPVFVLVDPLDGTREFIAGRNEFTINIGIVADGAAVAGVVAAPARGLLWRGIVGRGAERLTCDGESMGEAVAIATRPFPGATAVALVSRSHADAASAALLDRLGITNQRVCGSALKFCLLAQGEADVYPRLAPTRAWDVAAGQALLTAAGGVVVRPDAAPLRYDALAPPFGIPGFIACGDPNVLARPA
jgi:3'(2'), 5'-bisphosphate nucleotidase